MNLEKYIDDAKTNLPILIEEGSKYVKPELVDKWKHLMDDVDVDSQRFVYLGFEVIVKIMRELSNSVDFSNLNNVIDEIDYMGYYPWNVSNAIEEFHPKGEEFKLFLEKRFEEKNNGITR